MAKPNMAVPGTVTCGCGEAALLQQVLETPEPLEHSYQHSTANVRVLRRTLEVQADYTCKHGHSSAYVIKHSYVTTMPLVVQ